MNVNEFWNKAFTDNDLRPLMRDIQEKAGVDNWPSEYKKFTEKISQYLDNMEFWDKLTRVRRRKFLKSLERKILAESAKMPPVRDVNKELQKYLLFRGKPIKISDLDEDYVETDIEVKENVDVKKLQDFLTEIGPTLDDEENRRLSNLRKIIDSRAEQTKIEIEAKHTEALNSLYREIGEFDLGHYPDRKEIYDYWKGISEKFEGFNKALEDFFRAAKAADYESDIISGLGVIGEKNKFEGLVENYVGEFKNSDFKIKFPANFEKAIQIVQKYHEIQGLSFKPRMQRGENPSQLSVMESAEVEADRDIDPTEGIEEDTGSTSEERKEMEEVMQRAEEGVDPLLYYQLQETGFNRVKPKKSDIAEVREAIQFILDIKTRRLDPETEEEIEEEYFSPAQKEEFENWAEEIYKDTSDIPQNETYHYPYTSFTISQSKRGSGISTKYEKLLKLIAELIEGGHQSFASYSRNLTEDLDDITESFKDYKGDKLQSGGRRAQQAHNRIRGRILNEPFNPTGKDMSKALLTEWNALLDSINDYILIPMTSEFMIEKELPKWFNNMKSKIIEMQNAAKNPIGNFLKRTISEGLGRLEADDIDSIMEFIELIRNPTKGFDIRKTYDLGEDAVEGLTAMWGNEEEQNNIESIGGIIVKYAEATGYDDSQLQELPDFMGENIFELYSNYVNESNRNKYPILLLRSVLQMPPFKAYPSEWFGDLGKKIQELGEQLDSFSNKIENAEINYKLLEAHDTIRKMNGKPLVWAMLSLDEISHMDDIINKMEKEHRVDITATEINSIVKSVSSYDSLARNHGVNEEIIYTVKAMFR
jgi:hypothetical protein